MRGVVYASVDDHDSGVGDVMRIKKSPAETACAAPEAVDEGCNSNSEREGKFYDGVETGSYE